eukprot:TRINITY_DN8117_c0_g1_i3.p1 TRINITY_DN8117_c0_g1~~TRINITY_DN8117_c0_g1_i3.p1  ORF type:complete len:210 (-),score=81.34 TRINITY_DN8117_c0_g1_i3:205-834(-)
MCIRDRSRIVEITDPNKVFANMANSTLITKNSRDMKFWASSCSEQIINEYEKRMMLKDQADALVYDYYQENLKGRFGFWTKLNKNPKEKLKEFTFRENYWRYFKIGHDAMSKLTFYIMQQIEALKEENAKKKAGENGEKVEEEEEEEEEAEEDDTEIKMYIKDLEKAVEENFNDIALLRQKALELGINLDTQIVNQTGQSTSFKLLNVC